MRKRLRIKLGIILVSAVCLCGCGSLGYSVARGVARAVISENGNEEAETEDNRGLNEETGKTNEGNQVQGVSGETEEKTAAGAQNENTGKSGGTAPGVQVNPQARDRAGKRAESEENAGEDEGRSAAEKEYILPNSSTDYLTWGEISGLSAEECRIARNEIYARHGRRFQSQELQTYFDSKSWYQGTIAPEKFSENALNAIEKANVQMLKEMEPADALPGLPEAPSKSLIDRYGYESGHSALSFDIKSRTLKDCGEYYQIDAVFGQGIEAPGNLRIGEQVTLVFNELTGETKTLVRKEDGLHPVGPDSYDLYYYHPTENNQPVVLYWFSDDRVDKPVYEGPIYIRKDATDEVAITGDVKRISPESLTSGYAFYNGVFFDQKGYAVRMVYYGD